MSKVRLLVVEDQSIIALDLKNRLSGLGYEVVGTVAYAEAAIQQVGETRPDLVLMDIRLKGEMDGIQAAERIRAEYDLPVIYLTAHSDDQTLQRARLTEPYGYILKPFEDRELHLAIEIALYKHRMEAQLKEHERWLAATLTSIGDAVIATDRDGRIKFMNPAAEAAMGWAQAEALGQEMNQIFKLVNEETRAPVMSPVARVLRDGAVVGLANHTVLVARDGREAPIEDSAAPIRDERGNLTGVVLVFHDVTERRRAARKLQDSEKQFRQVVEHIHDALIRDNAAGQVTFANDQFLTLFGLEREQLTHLKPEDYVAPEWRDQWRDRHDRQMRGATAPANFEFEGLRPDGQRLWLEVDVAPLLDDAGRVIGTQSAIRDITARKQAEEALQASEKRFRALIENSADGITVVGPNGTVTYSSPSIARILGYSPDERRGRPLTELLHPDDLPGSLAQLGQLLQTPGGSATAQSRFRHRDGSWRWLEVTATNLLNDPAVRGIVANFQDITERKQAEEALRESEERLRQAVRVSRIGIFDHDHTTDLIYWSSEQRQHYGWSADEPVTLPGFLARVHPDDREAIATAVRRAHDPAGDGLFDVEHRILRRDGSVRWLSTRSQTVFDGHGSARRPVRTIGAVLDVTERKRAEEQLRQFSRAVEQSPASIVITDTAGRIEYVNPRFTEVTGYGSEEVIGQNLRFLKSGETPEAEFKQLWATLTSGGEWRGEFSNKKKNGELFWELASISAIRNERDEITNYLAVNEDITERRRAAEALRVSNTELARLLAQAKELAAAAQQASRLKDEILANTSHELRTPLTAIMGALDIVLGGLYASEDEMRSFIRAARDASDKLLDLVTDLLDLAKLEAGRLHLEHETVDLPLLLAEVQALMRGQAEHKGLTLETQLPANPLPPCSTDPDHLRRILLNLLNNAIKFTAQGRITITVRELAGQPAQNGPDRQVQIAIQDTGIGIPLEVQTRLFQPFVQADGSTTRRYGGTGLGLSISRRLTEMLGGSLTLASAGEGCGTTATLTMPLA